MTDIPFLMLVFVLAFITVVLSMGYIFRTKFPVSMILFFSGAIFLLLFITTDNIEALGLDTTETANYTLSYPMQVTTGTTGLNIGDTNHATAERPANINSLLYNTKISCITIDMAKVGSPTGTAIIGIISEDRQIVKSFGTIDVSTLLTTQARYMFCLPNHDYWIISLYDRAGIFYSTGSVGNTVNVFTDPTNTFDSTNSHRTSLNSAGTWSDQTTSDLRSVLISEDLTVSNNQELYAIRNPTTFEPTFIGISLILLSLCLIILGGLVETGKFN